MDVSEYVNTLELPEIGPRFESADESEIKFSGGSEAIALGSQLTEFDEHVPLKLRKNVADSMLLAQLAANKTSRHDDDVITWYHKYVSVLKNIGWLVEDSELQDRAVNHSNAGVHSEIIPIITAALAPHAAAASIALSVLKGLEAMDGDSKWVTVFDKSSQHAQGAKFQVSYVAIDPAGDPIVTVFCFAIEAARTITQVLFFKFSADRVQFKHGSTKLLIHRDRLSSSAELISRRIQPYVTEYVENIEL